MIKKNKNYRKKYQQKLKRNCIKVEEMLKLEKRKMGETETDIKYH